MLQESLATKDPLPVQLKDLLTCDTLLSQAKIHRDISDGLQAAKELMSVQHQQSAAADTTFTESLPSFVLNYGGWSDASLQAAATQMEQLIDDHGRKRYA